MEEMVEVEWTLKATILYCASETLGSGPTSVGGSNASTIDRISSLNERKMKLSNYLTTTISSNYLTWGKWPNKKLSKSIKHRGEQRNSLVIGPKNMKAVFGSQNVQVKKIWKNIKKIIILCLVLL